MGILSDLNNKLSKNSLNNQIIDKSNRMKEFCNGDKSFVLGEFKEWEKKCLKQGKKLNPDDFKNK